MGYRLLIVDDSKLARMAVAKALNSLHPDWTRVEAANADEALALAKDGAADLAILDFNMPGRDGLTLAAELRDMDPDMPVAVISANSQKEIIERAREAGAEFIQKPLSETDLANFLNSATQRLRTAVR